MLEIWLDASIAAHDFIDADFWVSKLTDMRDVYLPLAETVVYDQDGTIQGFASLYKNSLAAIFVLPEFQGQGIGKQLMEKVKSLRGELNLTVYKKNANSIAFYERCGFKKIREQTDEHTGHPEIVMEWKP